MKNTGYRRYRGRRVAPASKKTTLIQDILTVVVTALVAMVIFRVVLQLAWVPSGSMETTIPTRSLLVAYRLPYLVGDPEVEQGDIITFWSDELDKLLVKRVVGVAGDEISFDGGYVYVNGVKLSEPYLDRQGHHHCAQRNCVPRAGGKPFYDGRQPRLVGRQPLLG